MVHCRNPVELVFHGGRYNRLIANRLPTMNR
jgi:hypothetical protein